MPSPARRTSAPRVPAAGRRWTRSSRQEWRPPFSPGLPPNAGKRCRSSPQTFAFPLLRRTVSFPDAGGNPLNTLPTQRPSPTECPCAVQCWAPTWLPRWKTNEAGAQEAGQCCRSQRLITMPGQTKEPPTQGHTHCGGRPGTRAALTDHVQAVGQEGAHGRVTRTRPPHSVHKTTPGTAFTSPSEEKRTGSRRDVWDPA